MSWAHHVAVFPASWHQSYAPEQRRVLADMVMWCLQNVGLPEGKGPSGRPDGRWKTIFSPPIQAEGGKKRRVFLFRDDDAAVAFKLRWAEYL